MTTAGTAETGQVAGDERLHAVKPGLSGAQARCGAGRIVLRVPGRFEPSLPGACPECGRASG